MWFDKYFEPGWNLAFRRKEPGKELFRSDDGGCFCVIRNPWRYWCADPFLFEDGGTEYIFCEAYDLFRNKGVIGYRTIDAKGKVSPLEICLETDGHLSFPNVFRVGNEIYMVPETGDQEEIAVYQAVQFPHQWQKVKVLLKNVSACDTCFVSYKDQHYMLTQIFDRSAAKYVYDKLYLYRWDGNRFCAAGAGPVVEDCTVARNAGNVILEDDMMIRVSQNCGQIYGENLNFLKILQLNAQNYREELWRSVCVQDIRTNRKCPFDGIHTYNRDGEYEVIDLQRSVYYRLERMLYLIIYKIRHIFSF